MYKIHSEQSVTLYILFASDQLVMDRSLVRCGGRVLART